MKEQNILSKQNCVYIKDFQNSRKWIPGRIVEVQGPLSNHVEQEDGHVVFSHVMQLISGHQVQKNNLFNYWTMI